MTKFRSEEMKMEKKPFAILILIISCVSLVLLSVENAIYTVLVGILTIIAME
jgi:hypothetical protein